MVVVVRPQIPAADEKGLPTLRRGDRGEDVRTVQEVVGLPADGRFGPHTEAKVREIQRAVGLVPDGIVGPKTWVELLKRRPRAHAGE